jgi:multidrug efflux pump
MSPNEAIVQACLLRFRPIMMTTLAALFGALPLAIESGTGAELRFPLGISIIGGLLLSQLLTLYTTPVIYLALDAERNRKLSAFDAVREASLLRFRPIMMTTLAALLGALPLALGRGEGAEVRRPLGVAIVGGLLASQLLTLYTTPVMYLYLDRARAWAAARRRR